MTIPKPHFELARVYDDGTRETEIVSVVALPWDTLMGRRGFLGAGATAVAVLGALNSACSKSTPTPPTSADTKGPRKDATTTSSIVADCDGLIAHSEGVRALAVGPRGDFLASASGDKTIKLWGVPDGELLRTLTSQKTTVDVLVVTPGSELLASGRADSTITLWSLPSGKLRKTFHGHDNSATALAASADGELLAFGTSRKTITLWTLPDNKLLRTLSGHSSPVSALVISPDGKLLASGSEDKTIKLWSVPDGALLKTLEGHTNWISALVISPDGKLLASGGDDTRIKLWRMPDGELLKTLEEHTNSISALAISPDGKLLASGSGDQRIKLWALPDGALLKTLRGHTNSISALVISPEGKLLASGSEDKTIKLWGLPDGEFKTCLIDLKSTPSEVRGLTYRSTNAYGKVVTYTMPCGAPIPPGAVCTCNCVPGSYKPYPSYTPTPSHKPVSPASTTGGYQYCTCNKVCVCIPVCQAHRLLHPDSEIRTMAEEILLLMGRRQFEYMKWAAENAEAALRKRIYQKMEAIRSGAQPNRARWPSVQRCLLRLYHCDEVVALMAADLLRQRSAEEISHFSSSARERIEYLSFQASLRPWYLREAGNRIPSHAGTGKGDSA
jgi:WD40 repeat protein